MEIVLTEEEALAVDRICKDLPVFPQMKDGKPLTQRIGKIGIQLIDLCKEKGWEPIIEGKKIKPRKQYVIEEKVMRQPKLYMSLVLKVHGVDELPKAMKRYLEEYKEWQLWVLGNKGIKADEK